ALSLGSASSLVIGHQYCSSGKAHRQRGGVAERAPQKSREGEAEVKEGRQLTVRRSRELPERVLFFISSGK
ncbi:unnamed protein product, partial [Staurois parvus]